MGKIPLLSRDKVIEQFKSAHGDRYNYDRVEYLGNTVKVNIVCNIHGDFWQAPADHKAGKGCQKCAKKLQGKKPLTTEIFISKSVQTHGDKYDYSESEYIDSDTKVKIICKEHGEFFQIPYAHFGNNQGCPSCAHKKTSERCRLDTDHFIRKAKEVHGDIYDYSKSAYSKCDAEVIIICRTHGEFKQTPDSHYVGSGCHECGKYSPNRKLTKDEFVKKSNEAHQSFYDYSETEYSGSDFYLDIRCPKHGKFSQRASHHMNGSGCPICSKDKIAEAVRLTQEEFLQRAKQIHKEDYSYENVIYSIGKERVNVTCRKHGSFSIRPSNLLTGYGCNSCSRERRNLSLKLPHTLYVIVWDNITKIGITCREVEERMRDIVSDSGKNFSVLKSYKDLDRGDCFQLETEILNLLQLRYYPIAETFNGSTECFEDVDRVWLLNTIEEKIKNLIENKRRYGNKETC